MTFWKILPHATMCVASNRLVLLDVRSDRYSMVPPELTVAVQQWLNSSGHEKPPETFLNLITRAGTLRCGDPPLKTTRVAATPPSKALSTSAKHAAPGIVMIAQVFATVCATQVGLKTRPLVTLLEKPAGTLRVNSAPEDNMVKAVAAAFDRARSLVPVRQRCLLDSIALRRCLKLHDLSADLVFGVCGAPFEAHCWLQSGDMLVNDSYDHVSRFRPILIS